MPSPYPSLRSISNNKIWSDILEPLIIVVDSGVSDVEVKILVSKLVCKLVPTEISVENEEIGVGVEVEVDGGGDEMGGLEELSGSGSDVPVEAGGAEEEEDGRGEDSEERIGEGEEVSGSDVPAAEEEAREEEARRLVGDGEEVTSEVTSSVIDVPEEAGEEDCLEVVPGCLEVVWAAEVEVGAGCWEEVVSGAC